ncbi:hypothetical protein C8F01DRAFT_640221 [Mycena amicta]|nr:hypothetical protein C8F01DRAFT_640221 [Mycena amicta]
MRAFDSPSIVTTRRYRHSTNTGGFSTIAMPTSSDLHFRWPPCPWCSDECSTSRPQPLPPCLLSCLPSYCACWHSECIVQLCRARVPLPRIFPAPAVDSPSTPANTVWLYVAQQTSGASGQIAYLRDSIDIQRLSSSGAASPSFRHPTPRLFFPASSPSAILTTYIGFFVALAIAWLCNPVTDKKYPPRPPHRRYAPRTRRTAQRANGS